MKVKNPAPSKKVEKIPNTPSTLVIKSSPLLISPYKMRSVTELMRRQNLDYLLSHLPFLPHRGGRLILELLQKEVKYWEKKGLSPSDFYIQKVQTNPGQIRKKIIFRAKGRADRIRRRSSLVEICLSKKSS